MSHENVEVVRLAYAAINDGDLKALAELATPDTVFDFSQSIGPDQGIYRGREAVGRLIAANREAYERVQLSPIEFAVAPGGEIVVRHHVSARGRASGVEIDAVTDVALVWELRDGKVTKTTMYQPHVAALEAVGLRG